MGQEMSDLRNLAEMAAAVSLPMALDERLQDLMDRNNEGKLSLSERQELEAFVTMSESLSLLRAKALQCLGRAY